MIVKNTTSLPMFDAESYFRAVYDNKSVFNRRFEEASSNYRGYRIRNLGGTDLAD